MLFFYEICRMEHIRLKQSILQWIISFSCVILSLQNAAAQDSILVKKIKTNIEQLSEKEGVAIKQEFIALGQAGAMRIDYLRVEEIEPIQS